MTISIARKTAFNNLLRIEKDGSFSSELLAGHSSDIPERDVNLIYSLTLGVLRKQILLDFIIDLYSKTKTVRQDVEVLIILRLGLFQLLFLDKIPGYSAVNESVELTRFAKKKSASGLVNAVLRKASKWDGKLPEMPDTERISIETSHPHWLIEKWVKDFGRIKAEEIANANNSQPRAAFRMTSAFDRLEQALQTEIINELDARDDIKRSELVEGGFTSDRIDSALRSLSKNGLIYFQDQGSQLIGESTIKKQGKRILDLCAAPGSKATQIARSLNRDKLLAACEINFRRTQILRQNALRQKARLEVICADGTLDLPFAQASFDTILVDAPCSGTGTIRRNPEIRYRITKADVEQLKSKQLRLLENASKVLNENGSIVYSTCSLEREENEDVISEFMANVTGFAIESIGSPPPNVTDRGFTRTFPGEKGSDGFFITCLRRV